MIAHDHPYWMPAHDFTAADGAPGICRVCHAERLAGLVARLDRIGTVAGWLVLALGIAYVVVRIIV